LRTVKLQDDSKPHDARRRQDGRIRARNQMSEAFDRRLDIFDARPDSEIAPFDLSEDAIDSPGQFDTELCGIQR
jgi:hypothetical protein